MKVRLLNCQRTDCDKLYKIRDLLNIIRGNIQGALNPQRNIAIDETLVKLN